tara:strand:- start:2463 stop:2702 length:240 start_codon:yes stop_codon:yes gene_type:complete
VNILEIIKKWAISLSESMLSLIIFFILFDLLTGNVKIPYSETIDVTTPVIDLLNNVGKEGGAGIVFAWVLYSIYKVKNK